MALFRIDIVLLNDALAFAPDGPTFNDAMQNVIQRFVDGVVSVPKLINHVSLALRIFFVLFLFFCVFFF